MSDVTLATPTRVPARIKFEITVMTHRIALTLRVTGATGYNEPRDSLSQDWCGWVTGLGMTPVLIPNVLPDPVAYLKALQIHALLLTGGDDVGDPPERARTEEALFHHAAAAALPVLGVCRGLQLINSLMGGTLTPIADHVANTHTVRIADPWQQFYGKTARVNSFHNIGIASNALGEDLVVTAEDENGYVEAARHNRLPIAAVMWHPERKGAPSGDAELLRHLVGQGQPIP